MARTLFKFTKPSDGFIRRAGFSSPPSWAELSTKIEALYKISSENVGVTYIDEEGDEITLNSDEELQDLYNDYQGSDASNGTPSFGSEATKAIRFTVLDITLGHESKRSKPISETLLLSPKDWPHHFV